MSFEIYDMLIANARSDARVRAILLGLNWSVCRAEGVGICFSPSDVVRTLPWPGTLLQRSTNELTPWILSDDAAEATVGSLVVNACINVGDNPLLMRSKALDASAPGHLRVFAHFASRIRGASVTVVGRYPGLDLLWQDVDYQCLERIAGPGRLPEAAAEHLLPRSEWVFLTGSAIANKTLPRLLTLSREATVVLMGPSVPWLDAWAHFHVDYLAGVAVTDAEALFQTAAEAGGTRLFETSVEYRLLQLR